MISPENPIHAIYIYMNLNITICIHLLFQWVQSNITNNHIHTISLIKIGKISVFQILSHFFQPIITILTRDYPSPTGLRQVQQEIRHLSFPTGSMYLAKSWYFTDLDFAEIRGFPLLNHHLRSCEVAII